VMPPAIKYCIYSSMEHLIEAPRARRGRRQATDRRRARGPAEASAYPTTARVRPRTWASA
jgi:hypothetical protein